MRVGIGYDVHQLVEGRPLIVGGVNIIHEKGLMGHSDADVLTHAIMDAIIGALGLGDIGKLFPDNDMAYKDISSLVLLEKVKFKMIEKNFQITNIDATIIAQRPKFLPYLSEMVERLSDSLDCSKELINLKATTTEKLGFEGREEGISAQAVVLLHHIGGAHE